MRILQKLGLCAVAYTALDQCLNFLQFTGPSMEPTIKEDDMGVGEKLTSFKGLRRGDIVTVKAPDDPSMTLCKRIVGLPGDKVTYDYPNLRDDNDGSMEDFVTVRRFVPRGHVWLEGDNSSRSYDSRMYGPVPLGLVQSRVFAKVYPFNKFIVFARESKES